MAVFVVLPDNPQSQAFANRINTTIKQGDSLRLPGGAWLVSYDGTSRALSDALGISENETTTGIVMSVASYWGRQNKDVWEWISLKQK